MPLNRFSLTPSRPVVVRTTQQVAVGRSSSTQSRTPFLSWTDRERMKKQESRSQEAKSMERNFTREWKAGDVYAPHDLSAAEARKWRKKYSPTTDAFDALSLNPLDLYKNFAVMSEYMSDTGRIRPATSTGLRRVNQRKLAKALRRSIALGLMPSIHRHPEIIRDRLQNQIQAQGGRI